MNIIVVPDSFKGTMSAVEVCETITDVLKMKDPAADIIAIPMADGGEGTCDAFHYALGGEIISARACGPYLEPKDAYYWRKNETAVIELAAAAGFIEDEFLRNPAVTSTYGVGELICHAIEHGCNRIILGLGGSCTNDAGLGIAAALGASFTDTAGEAFIPTGSTIENIRSMDLERLRQKTGNVQFEVMCDVNNPLYGELGAAYIFAPQKGADPAMVEMLDRNLRSFAELIRETVGIDIADIPGGGAAGGAGAGAYALLNAQLRPGAQIILEMNRFEELLKRADLVITGEGCLDEQSLQGKVISAVSEHAKAGNVPVVAVVGNTEGDFTPIYALGVKDVVRTIDYSTDPEHYGITCRQDLHDAVWDYLNR